MQEGGKKRPTIVELDRKEEEKRESGAGGGLSRDDVEKYMYANLEESKELSTPGRITNPDNVSESSVMMGDEGMMGVS